MNMLIAFKNCGAARKRLGSAGYQMILSNIDVEVLIGSLMGRGMEGMSELLRDMSPSELKQVETFIAELSPEERNNEKTTQSIQTDNTSSSDGTGLS